MHVCKWFIFLVATIQPVTAYPGNNARLAVVDATELTSVEALITTTSIWTQSSTSTIWHTPFGPDSYIDYITTQTVTQTSSRGSFPTYPATVVDHGTTTVHYSQFEVWTDKSVDSHSWTSTYTSATTFVVYKPQPTDMPAGLKVNDVPCGPCSNATATWKADPQCDALGLDTACQGQCSLQNGFWWCRQLQGLVEMGLNPEYQMGRICWGNRTRYHQLLTPCINGDHQFECLSCTVSLPF